ncbi:MAG: hypothetical protein ABFS32_07560 [Bacteroidota bacterium]
MKALRFTFIMIFILNINVYAQSFISPVGDFPPGKECKVVLVDGTEITGTFSSLFGSGGNINSLTIKDEEGNKHKYKAIDIHRFYVKMGFLAKLDATAEASSSLKEVFKTDFKEISKREYVIYEQALLPKKKDKYRLLQLVNPGFDSKIKVYHNPSGAESGGLGIGDLQLTGGEEKTYLVEIGDAKSILVKKKKYKNMIPELYGDCPELIKILGAEKIKFKNMAAHVYGYDQLCGSE